MNDCHEWICWETWNDQGYRTRTSKSHIVNPENDRITVCGQFIPDRPGVVIEHGELGDGVCKCCVSRSTDDN
tara:strand:+ start:880 stop:1095 length:216 start_codon:yes stop_codon:yes gene_type:complete